MKNNDPDKYERVLFAERLNHALDIYGVPPKGRGRQIETARMFGVSQKGASKWLEGQTFPEIEKIKVISERLNVNLEWLLTGKGYINIESIPCQGKSAMTRIPLLDWKDAPNWRKIAFGQGTKWAWADADVGPRTFALEVMDESMMPRYAPKDILIVDPELVAVNQTVVIAQRMSGEIISRQLFFCENGNKYLKPNNLDYPAILITLNSKIEIIGSVRQVFMGLEE